MKRLAQDDLKVRLVVEKMYEQRAQVGKISSFVGYENMEYLKEELLKLGWIASLSEDQTISLEPAPESEL